VSLVLQAWCMMLRARHCREAVDLSRQGGQEGGGSHPWHGMRLPVVPPPVEPSSLPCCLL